MAKFSDYKETSKKYGGGDWMSIVEGENRIRIVSEFEDYGNHFDPAVNRSNICLGKEECKYCQEGKQPAVQYLGWVIDRKDNQVKMLRIGYSINKQIGDYQKNPEYVFDVIPPYDITIIRTGQGRDTSYSVQPARQNTDLTEEEQKIIDEKVRDPKDIIESMKAKQREANNLPSEEESLDETSQ